MKWILNDGYVVDAQTGEVQCLLSKSDDKLRDKIIEIAPELFTTVISFVEQIDSGKNVTKSFYNDIKEVLSRVPEELMYDERVQV